MTIVLIIRVVTVNTARLSQSRRANIIIASFVWVAAWDNSDPARFELMAILMDVRHGINSQQSFVTTKIK